MAAKIKMQESQSLLLRWLQQRARAHFRKLSQTRIVAGAKGLRKAEVSILLVSDLKMRKINGQWRGKDSSTDVLSFPLFDGKKLKIPLNSQLPLELGDVVISLPTAKRQAREHQLTLRRELDLLLVHGILHLLGFDHERSKSESLKMQNWEKKLLGKAGLIR